MKGGQELIEELRTERDRLRAALEDAEKIYLERGEVIARMRALLNHRLQALRDVIDASDECTIGLGWSAEQLRERMAWIAQSARLALAPREPQAPAPQMSHAEARAQVFKQMRELDERLAAERCAESPAPQNDDDPIFSPSDEPDLAPGEMERTVQALTKFGFGSNPHGRDPAPQHEPCCEHGRRAFDDCPSCNDDMVKKAPAPQAARYNTETGSDAKWSAPQPAAEESTRCHWCGDAGAIGWQVCPECNGIPRPVQVYDREDVTHSDENTPCVLRDARGGVLAEGARRHLENVAAALNAQPAAGGGGHRILQDARVPVTNTTAAGGGGDTERLDWLDRTQDRDDLCAGVDNKWSVRAADGSWFASDDLREAIDAARGWNARAALRGERDGD